MKLGFDIDDTINYQYEFLIDRGLKFAHKEGLMDKLDQADYSQFHPFNWDRETMVKFWVENRAELVRNLPPKAFSAEVLHKLKDEGHEIHLVTARTEYDQLYPDYMQGVISRYTRNWLNDFNIPYDELHFATADKGECCIENGIEVMIEDDVRNLRKLMGKSHIIVYDMPYNHLPEFEGLDRAHGWYEVYYKIHKFIESKAQ